MAGWERIGTGIYWVGGVASLATIVALLGSSFYYFAKLENRVDTMEKQFLILTTARAIAPRDENASPEGAGADATAPPDEAALGDGGSDFGWAYYEPYVATGPVGAVCADLARDYVAEVKAWTASGSSPAAIRSLMTDLGCFPAKP